MMENFPKNDSAFASSWLGGNDKHEPDHQSGVPLRAWRDWEFRCEDPRAGVNVTENSWFFDNRSRFRECWRQWTPATSAIMQA